MTQQLYNWVFISKIRRSAKKGYMLSNVHSSNVCNSQTVEGTKMPFNRQWIKKKWHIYPMEYYSTIKNNDSSTFSATWTALEEIMLREISQSSRERQLSYGFTHLWNIKSRMIGRRRKERRRGGKQKGE